VPAKWRKLFALIPGYDPFKDADGCRFDPDAAQLALDFFPECLRHIEGDLAGQPFTLEPWQQAIVACLFGWKQLDEQQRIVRRYREVLVYVPRKNGKTPLVAGIGLLVLFTDGEIGQQDYIAAGDREQAALLFRHAKGMVELEPELDDRCDIYGGNAAAGQSRSIVIEEDGSFLRVISADAKTKHGGNMHLGILEELHVQPDRELYDVLRTATASKNRKQPLVAYVTTADFLRDSICNETYEYACKVRDGIVPNPRFLPVIFEAAAGDDWKAESTWRKANPNLGVSVSLDYLKAECLKAQETPAYENTFKRLHLNIRTEQDVRAIAMDKWNSCAADVADPMAWRLAQLATLKNEHAGCFAGLDLGSTSDLTALGLVFPRGSRFVVLPYFWVPEEGARVREKRDRVPYGLWIKDGWIRQTGGNVTDYDVVRKDVNEIVANFWLRELAVDRLFQGAQLCTQLQGDGLPVVAFGQGFFSMAAPTKRILELILQGLWDHGGNPVLKWQASNAATEEDAAGNLKFSKSKSSEKIDGIVASTMSLGRAMLVPEGDTAGVELW
jgi:phage terminase large subunit-like protein